MSRLVGKFKAEVVDVQVASYENKKSGEKDLMLKFFFKTKQEFDKVTGEWEDLIEFNQDTVNNAYFLSPIPKPGKKSGLEVTKSLLKSTYGYEDDGDIEHIKAHCIGKPVIIECSDSNGYTRVNKVTNPEAKPSGMTDENIEQLKSLWAGA